MSYARRNSIILGLLLVLTVSLGTYWTAVRQVDQIRTLGAREDALYTELERVNAVLAIYDSTLAGLNRLKARWQTRTQVVPPADSPARTLAYIDDVIRTARLSVSFDFLYKGVKDEGRCSVNRYAMEGEARFRDLYAFIWYLERGHRFYTVDHLEIDYRERDVKSPHWDWVHFKMLFRAYFEPRSRIEDLPPVQTSARPLAKLRNPFRPLITATLPENRLGLFEVDGARLKGLAHNLAYLVDRTGEASVLREGDRVFLGKLSKIDIDANRVEFVLNKGGIWERLRLHVEIETLQR